MPDHPFTRWGPVEQWAGLTALPSSIAFGSLSGSNVAWWAGLS